MTQAIDLRSMPSIKLDGGDNTTAISDALHTGKRQHQPVLIPAGTWTYSDVLVVEGIELYGEEGATLHSLNTDRAAIELRGFGPGIRSLRLTGVVPAMRSQKDSSARVRVIGATEFTVTDMQIESGSSAGVLVRNSDHGSIEHNRISGTLADSVHITGQSSFIEVLTNTIERSGDDGIAVVSYRKDGGLCHDILARGNTIINNVGGRCMSVVGGENVRYEFNEMRGNVKAAGLYLAQEKSYDTYALKNVTAKRNTIVNCGNKAIGHFAVMLFSNAERNDGVRLERNLIVGDGIRGGIRVYGDQTNIALDSNLGVNAADLIVTTGVVVTPYSAGSVGVA